MTRKTLTKELARFAGRPPVILTKDTRTHVTGAIVEALESVEYGDGESEYFYSRAQVLGTDDHGYSAVLILPTVDPVFGMTRTRVEILHRSALRPYR